MLIIKYQEDDTNYYLFIKYILMQNKYYFTCDLKNFGDIKN